MSELLNLKDFLLVAMFSFSVQLLIYIIHVIDIQIQIGIGIDRDINDTQDISYVDAKEELVLLSIFMGVMKNGTAIDNGIEQQNSRKEMLVPIGVEQAQVLFWAFIRDI